jgi:hypothetical protein
MSLEKILPKHGPIVLCGEPGSGKSTELKILFEKARASATAAEFFSCLSSREIADSSDFRRQTIESDTWREWRRGSTRLTLVIDGIDEGLLRVPNLINDLTSILRKEPSERIRLILACRTAEWPVEMGRALFSLWPATEREPIHELCPLRKVDVEIAARSLKYDPERFLAAVWDRNVEALAARPVTLFLLLSEFSQHVGLPSTHRELYERGTANLVREIDSVRRELLQVMRKTTARVSDAQRLLAAQRLATMLLLAGRSAVRISRDEFTPASDHDLYLESAESDGTTRDALEEAVESALFTSLGERRFGFVHQTFAECLAAQQLDSLPLLQLRRLLCRRDGRGEHVVPQLGELAAWVAGTHPGFCEYLLQIEPAALLRSDVTRMPPSLKGKLVEAVLTGAKADRIFDNFGGGQFLGGLIHPGLSEQLRPIIADSNSHVIARRIAFRIAEESRAQGLVETLLKVVNDSTESLPARSRAMDVLVSIIPDDRLALLEPMARGEAEGDANDSLKGSALQKLVPGYWKVRDVLAFLTPRQNSKFMGEYVIFLTHHLPSALREDDLAHVLAWLRADESSYRRSSRSSVHKLGEAAFVMALERLHMPLIAHEVVKTWQVWARGYELHQLSNDSLIRKSLVGNGALTQQFCELYLNSVGTKSDEVSSLLSPIPLLEGTGALNWLLDALPNVIPEHRSNWVTAIAYLTNDSQVMASCWDLLLTRIEEIKELGVSFEWLRPWNLNEPLARKAKAHWLRDQRRRARYARELSENVPPDPAVEIATAFRLFAKGDRSAWAHLWFYVASSKDDTDTDWYTCDLTNCVNWGLLSEVQKQSVSDLARSYLFSDHRNGNHRDSMDVVQHAGASAVWMLREDIAKDSLLRTVVIEKWLPVLAWNIDPDPEPRRALFAFGYALAPAAMRKELYLQAVRDIKKHRYPFVIRVARDCWDTALSTDVLQLIDTSSDPIAVLNGLTELAKLDREAVLAYVQKTLNSVVPGSEVYPIRLLGTLVVGLVSGAEQIWPMSEALLSADEDLSHIVLSKVTSSFDVGEREILKQFPEQVLAGLYILLHRFFPRESDPPRDNGGFDPARFIRGQIPGILATRATEEACQELRRLADTFPSERTSLSWTLQDAVTNVRRSAWQKPSPDELNTLITIPETRLINNDDDLLELIVESLERLQMKLTKQSIPAAEELWLWTGAGQNRSNFQPKDEESLSDYVARWLVEDIGPSAGVVVNREVQPRRGAKTDIIVDALSQRADATFNRLTVVIEVKGCWHDAVRTGMRTQLVDGYLRPHGWRCGVYLVGWFICPQWTAAKNKLQSGNLKDAINELEVLATDFHGVHSDIHVTPVLMDCTLPQPRRPSAS